MHTDSTGVFASTSEFGQGCCVCAFLVHRGASRCFACRSMTKYNAPVARLRARRGIICDSAAFNVMDTSSVCVVFCRKLTEALSEVQGQHYYTEPVSAVTPQTTASGSPTNTGQATEYSLPYAHTPGYQRQGVSAFPMLTPQQQQQQQQQQHHHHNNNNRHYYYMTQGQGPPREHAPRPPRMNPAVMTALVWTRHTSVWSHSCQLKMWTWFINGSFGFYSTKFWVNPQLCTRRKTIVRGEGYFDLEWTFPSCQDNNGHCSLNIGSSVYKGVNPKSIYYYLVAYKLGFKRSSCQMVLLLIQKLTPVHSSNTDISLVWNIYTNGNNAWKV